MNYLYAIPLKQFNNDTITIAAKPSITRYQVPHSKGVSLFCTSPLQDQFLRLAVAVKNKVSMLAYKHPASMKFQGSPVPHGSSVDPKESFIKHRVSAGNDSSGADQTRPVLSILTTLKNHTRKGGGVLKT